MKGSQKKPKRVSGKTEGVQRKNQRGPTEKPEKKRCDEKLLGLNQNPVHEKTANLRTSVRSEKSRFRNFLPGVHKPVRSEKMKFGQFSQYGIVAKLIFVIPGDFCHPCYKEIKKP